MAPLSRKAEIVEKLSQMNDESNERISKSFSAIDISVSFLEETFFSIQKKSYKMAKPSFK